MKEKSRCHQEAEKRGNRQIAQMLKTLFLCKLNHLQGELKKVQSRRREHAKVMKMQSKYVIQVHSSNKKCRA
ncbi:hypothetical protein MRX96_035270 [Rhipicephalus microplus]